MSQGKLHTFFGLLKDVDVIEIPVIQRDYAQGRAEESDIRESFLAAITGALENENSPLDLDFVYGSVEHDGLRTLSVLDGQQRLTTLFLLHWYLAASDGKFDDFRARLWIKESERTRFSYSTRPSAAEFFAALTVNHFDVPDVDERTTLSAMLVDSKWFFDAWRRDPTVRSSLVMLDAIDAKFRDSEGLYQTLADGQRVTFHYLDLHDFGLSDDLYIKMNARGKALTPFENFKAWMVERVAAEPWSDNFTAKLDQQWVDLFWTLAGRNGAGRERFDDLFLRFFYVSAYFQTCQRVSGYWNATNDDRSWLTRLREARGYCPLREFDATGSLMPIQLAEAGIVLDYLVSDRGARFFHILLSALAPRADYDDLLRLYALEAFLLSPDVRLLDEAAQEMCLHRWSRVTRNLIQNTRIDDPSTAVGAIKGLTTLANHATSLYETLAGDTPGGLGFNRNQIEEERQKAALLLKDNEWGHLLDEAESHWYLQGRVGFLLKLSTTESEAPDKEQFQKYSMVAKRLLTHEILGSYEFVLQRALLSLYDFLPASSGNNHTFCAPNATSFRDRLENWLPVFEDPRFRELLDAIGDDVLTSLRQLIDNSTATGWRALMVRDAELLRYCGSRLIRKSADSLLLLSKLKLSGYFAEAHSYALYLELRRHKLAGELADIKEISYLAVYGDDYPSLYIKSDTEYRLLFRRGKWNCWRSGGDPAEMPEPIAQTAARFS
ncbi:hypothetical protein R69658_05845 [Paraburkholderia aspalathi]|uniref:GmrSD restriction endonucleases N-terminal domain-containing protein n=1 Tax=Paraburkholderia aspalathi TaxID=1324617 RepID=A0ABN7MSJ2_9BURK|nr:DUF262 domain-containing protein [Paraburkholderia aspalathi]MBK3822156.1 DUF262 domain-containing protein [Paraburkholderia aspalathi]MBK3833990.1 DUF262 domain-containing protein [Paraburkholderia aspalathi]MBK3863715.1 DUF262 domain-containing protein [Paraburkholderia aspalathi]CAE6820916.1 hypothetical protein R69658_05845 [Paraburkholderia aspalathi]